MKIKFSLFICLGCFVVSCPVSFAQAAGVNATNDWATFRPPSDSKYDWIQLDSGEWLKGDLKVMYNQSLEFDSAKMDLQEFDFEDVVWIRTRNVQRIMVQKKGQDPEILTGKLEMREDKVFIRNNGQEQEYGRASVVAIAQRAMHERDRWSGSLSVGINLRGGNSETADATVIANLKRQTALTRYNLDYLANYSRTRDSNTANNQRLSLDANLFLNSQLFWRILDGEIYRDEFSNIDRQYSLQTGMGYYLANTSKAEWAVGAGVGYQRTEYISVEAGNEESSQSPFLAGGTKLDIEVNSMIDYLFDYSFRLLNDSNGQYTHHLVTTLSTDFIGDLDIDISAIWDRVKKPTADSSGKIPDQNDFQLIFSLAYDF